jgi:hypothetical protein
MVVKCIVGQLNPYDLVIRVYTIEKSRSLPIKILIMRDIKIFFKQMFMDYHSGLDIIP